MKNKLGYIVLKTVNDEETVIDNSTEKKKLEVYVRGRWGKLQ